jgi:hypothetical protein
MADVIYRPKDKENNVLNIGEKLKNGHISRCG